MEISIDNFYKMRLGIFKWNRELSLTNKVVFAFFIACITGILAQIVIPLPWTPVPITGQTFAVLMAGVVLGRYWGGISQVMYVAIGLAGVPWFTGMTCGYSVMFGATAGYLLGFILAALFLGYISDKYVKSRNFKPMVGLLLLSNFALIYIPGLIGLTLFLNSAYGSMPSIWTLLAMGVLPFVLGDLVKITGAASLTKVITPKEPYHPAKNI